jgi:hypothetical protein
MSAELAAVRAALDGGRSLEYVERSVLERLECSDERLAALWLYACAYATLRPRADLSVRLIRPMFR